MGNRCSWDTGTGASAGFDRLDHEAENVWEEGAPYFWLSFLNDERPLAAAVRSLGWLVPRPYLSRELLESVAFQPNRPTRLSGNPRADASSWSMGSIWDKSGPPSFARANDARLVGTRLPPIDPAQSAGRANTISETEGCEPVCVSATL